MTDPDTAVVRLERKFTSEIARLESKMARLEGKIESEVTRLEIKIDKTSAQLRDEKFDASLVRVENTMWKVGFAILGGGLAIGGLLLRYLR